MNPFWNDFKRGEFACRCGCGFDTIDAELADVLYDLRRFFGQPVIINSGCRCIAHNDRIGGSKNSRHTTGQAADITVLGESASAISGHLKKTYPKKYGIGKYTAWTHIDIRPEKARWNG